MRKNKQVIAMVALKDLGKAAEFYEGALGFEKVAVEGRELITYRRCGCVFNIYQSDYAGAKKATALTWVVGDDLEAVVRKLKANGVA